MTKDVWIECGEALVNLSQISHVVESSGGGCVAHMTNGEKINFASPAVFEQFRAQLCFPKDRPA